MLKLQQTAWDVEQIPGLQRYIFFGAARFDNGTDIYLDRFLTIGIVFASDAHPLLIREIIEPTRAHNRCNVCGRPRSTYKDFKLCRVCLRELALKGELPGVTKASW